MSAFKAYGRILAAASDLPDCLDPADVRDVQSALERARVVAVLDGWADKERGWHTSETWDKGDQAWLVMLHGPHSEIGSEPSFTGPTPDAARAAAARAIEAGEV